MSKKTTFDVNREKRPYVLAAGKFFFILFLFTLLHTGVWAQPQQNLSKRRLEFIYSLGKEKFYSVLDSRISSLSLTEQDGTFLRNERYKKKGLFEHLMNFYFYIQNMRTEGENEFLSNFSRLSGRLAEEFIQSLQINGASSLQPVLVSSGYYFKRTSPQFRKFLRPLGKKVKSQVALRDLQVKQAHSLSKGENIRIAVIDSGVDPTIKEIKGRIKKYKNLLDGSIPFSEKGSFPFDWNGHGTAVTSLINQIAPKAELMIVKFYDSDRMKQAKPSRWTAYLAAAGMIWAAENGADIVNLSAAFLEDLWPIREAARYCWERNVLVVTAMGNNFNSTDIPPHTYFPAQYPWTIAVGGTEKTRGHLKVWEHSGRGDYIDVVAPAIDLWVDLPSYLEQKVGSRMLQGNSLAVALVAGAAALTLAAMDDATRIELMATPGQRCEKVRSIFRATASNDSLGFSLPNPYSGYGQIEIHKAVCLAVSQKGLKKPGEYFNWSAPVFSLQDVFSRMLSR